MEKKRILVVDDDVDIRPLLEEALIDYEIRFCNNGAAALSVIQEENFMPHLILTDWQMPVIDGIELTKRVKSEIPDLPVIIMTGQPTWLPAKVPADVVLAKPFPLAELFEVIEKFINY
jgi:CheY-like chemotaxis protein